jgi:hypothetical protein
MSYYILPKVTNCITVNPIFADNICPTYCSFSLSNYYNHITSQINSICLHNPDVSYNYNELIQIINPYAYVFFTVPGSTYSVSKLKPKSNDFYDLLEICITLNILDTYSNTSIKSLHISVNSVDTVNCIEMLRENYKEDTIVKENEELLDAKFDIIIFNKPHDDIQIYMSQLFEFVMYILRHQELGGTSIIKIDHMFHKPIIDVMYILSSLFEKVYIIKPNTINITTFEKYIVCKNLNANIDTNLELYKHNYNKLNYAIKNRNKNIHSIMNNEIPYYFINKIEDINVILGHQQLESLNQIISILKNKNKEEKIEHMKKNSIQKAIDWCEKFKIPCHKFSEKTNIFLPIVKETDINSCLFSPPT